VVDFWSKFHCRTLLLRHPEQLHRYVPVVTFGRKDQLNLGPRWTHYVFLDFSAGHMLARYVIDSQQPIADLNPAYFSIGSFIA
jgi:hypothetical protein